MARRVPYTLVYANAIQDHLRAIDLKHLALIREKIEEQLLFEPDLETRNRKPLKQPAAFGAEWEIRFGRAIDFECFMRLKGIRIRCRCWLSERKNETASSSVERK